MNVSPNQKTTKQPEYRTPDWLQHMNNSNALAAKESPVAIELGSTFESRLKYFISGAKDAKPIAPKASGKAKSALQK